MFVFAVLVSVGVALLRGGRPERLADFPFQHVWLIFVALAIQVALHNRWLATQVLARAAAPYLYALVYGLLLVCFAYNRRAPGALWLGAGVLANLTVIVANGGKMPVDPSALTALGETAARDTIAAGENLINCLVGPTTRLPWLGDVLVGSPPFPRPTIFSAGDALLAIGVFILVQGTMVSRGTGAGKGRDRTAVPTPKG